MQFIFSDWPTCLVLVIGIAIIVAVTRGDLFKVDVRKGKAETRKPGRQGHE